MCDVCWLQERFEAVAKQAADKEGPLKGVSTTNEDKLKLYSLYKQVLCCCAFLLYQYLTSVPIREALEKLIPKGLECLISPARCDGIANLF